jgi:hypothetical protein
MAFGCLSGDQLQFLDGDAEGDGDLLKAGFVDLSLVGHSLSECYCRFAQRLGKPDLFSLTRDRQFTSGVDKFLLEIPLCGRPRHTNCSGCLGDLPELGILDVQLFDLFISEGSGHVSILTNMPVGTAGVQRFCSGL